MKRFTLTIFGLLLMVGGVFSQEVTTLYLDGGQYVSLSNQVYDEGSHVTGATVTFSKNKFEGKWNGLTGSNWVADLNAEETHTFTITLNSGAPAGFHFYIASNRYDDFGHENARKYVNATIPEGATSVSYSIDATTYPDLLLPENDHVGPYKWVYIVNEGTADAQLNIASITRTITTSSSVAAPTISPASGTYDGDLTVTITKGAGNEKVVYSVSGATTGNVTDAEFTTDSQPLTLTGTGTITVTAKGVVGSDESSEVTNTYTYDSNIPSGVISVWTGNQSFGGNWSENLPIDKSYFSDIEEGDYVYIYATHDGAVTDIGFRSDRNGWDEAPWYGFTNANGYTSGGNGAHGSMAADETYWWLKVGKENGTIKANVYEGDHDTDIALDAPYYFKNYNTIIQGLNFTLTSVEIHKAKSISESSDNSITKYTDMIVNLDRSFVAGTWNTVCLPFVPTSAQADELFGEGYQLAEFTSVSGTTMHFTTIAIGSFEAGKPYLVMPKTGCATGTTVLFDVDITAKTPQTVTYGDYSFVGTFTGKTFSGSECAVSRFVATENKLKTPTDGSTMKALRAYFTVPSTSPARSFTIDGDNTTTSISEETMVKGETSPNKIFNLAGQRVAQPTKGLYIVNGKKVVLNK